MTKGFVIMVEVVWKNTEGDDGFDIGPAMIIRDKEDIEEGLKKLDTEYVKGLFSGEVEIKECPKELMEKDWEDCLKVFYTKDPETEQEFNVTIYTEEVDMI